ncbi:MAG: carbohydrate kinase family protein [Chloroflexi bacterium]|mgnify:FL=1|nr:carbohydrate kinase family protein [Chloroflexota bacterium]
MKKIIDLNTEHLPSGCLAGNLNIDMIIRNVPNLPLWGQEVLGNNYSIVSSGQTAYTAFALRKFNISIKIIGNVGNDIYGEKIINDLANSGANIDEVEIVEDGKTGITVAIVRNDGERAFVSDPSSLVAFNGSLLTRHHECIKESDFFFLMGIFFLPGLELSDAQYTLAQAQAMGKITFLDTGWDPQGWQDKTIYNLRKSLQHVDYFIPNLDEAHAITSEKDPEKAASALLNDGAKSVIIKMGVQGSLAKTNEVTIYTPAHSVKVIDAVGAGDVFNAGFVFSRMQNWPLDLCLAFGTATSALYISKTKDRFPSLQNVVELVEKSTSIQFNFK